MSSNYNIKPSVNGLIEIDADNIYCQKLYINGNEISSLVYSYELIVTGKQIGRASCRERV